MSHRLDPTPPQRHKSELTSTNECAFRQPYRANNTTSTNQTHSMLSISFNSACDEHRHGRVIEYPDRQSTMAPLERFRRSLWDPIPLPWDAFLPLHSSNLNPIEITLKNRRGDAKRLGSPQRATVIALEVELEVGPDAVIGGVIGELAASADARS